MNYFEIDKCSVISGDGLRVCLWLSGCDHECIGCHNPETWDYKNGRPFDTDEKKEVLDELSKDYISGITFSGGDPLNEHNLDGVLDLIKEIRLSFPEKTIWLYTGFKYESLINMVKALSYKDPQYDNWLKRRSILYCIDVLVDGRYEEDKRDITLKFRGSGNQRVIDVQKSLEQNKIVLHCD